MTFSPHVHTLLTQRRYKCKREVGTGLVYVAAATSKRSAVHALGVRRALPHEHEHRAGSDRRTSGTCPLWASCAVRLAGRIVGLHCAYPHATTATKEVRSFACRTIASRKGRSWRVATPFCPHLLHTAPPFARERRPRGGTTPRWITTGQGSECAHNR